MSDPKEKQKSKKFLLPSSLKHIQEHYKNQTQSFVKNLNKAQDDHSQAKKQQKHHSLFKLNPSSTALVSQVPVDTLRKRSKSQKLESLNNEAPKESFFLLDHYKQTQERHIHEKKPILKNYKIDIRQMVTGENKYSPNNQEGMEEDEKYQIVKPSQPYKINKDQRSIFTPTIFQTPILPCFASEFQKKSILQTSKSVQQGEGVWKIGKLKVKGKKCELRVGQFLLQGDQVRGEGRAGVLSEQNLHCLPNWKDMWILQPHESLFTSD